MLISAFARAANLSPDTVRLYVKRGLLRPTTGRRGGSNPYLEFGAADLIRARLVRLARSLGFTLREIAALATEVEATGMSRARRIALFEERLHRLDEKAVEIARMTAYLRAKIAWMKNGERGPEPEPALADGEEPLAGLVDEIAASQPARPRKIRVAPR
jgi:DNA-binding transcriptional MerR regulator